jgi:hypothetical protein
MKDLLERPLGFPPLLLRRIPNGNEAYELIPLRNPKEFPYRLAIGLLISRNPA